MAGKMVSFPANGREGLGFLEVPRSGNGPGVMVVQEWWGLIDQCKSIVSRFAFDGFVALGPDFYHGDRAEIGEPDEAGKLMMALQADEVAKDARGAAQYLKALPEVTSDKVGVIGFCMGGQLALLAGTVAPDEIGAVVDMYGIHPNINPDFSKMKAPVLALFGGKDAMVNEDARKQLFSQLDAAGVHYEADVYSEADHAFMNDERPDTYDREASEDAWRRIVEFFRNNL